MVSPDAVATAVNAGAVDFEGAVMFRGWLLKVNGSSPARVRLFTDPGFMEWLEMPSSAILHQIPGKDQLNAEMRSVIWVKRKATITLCRSGCAYLFQHLEEEREHLYRDPTDDGAIHPRP